MPNLSPGENLSTATLSITLPKNFYPGTETSTSTTTILLETLGNTKEVPILLSGEEGLIPFNFANFGLDIGESVPAGVTATVWASYTTSDISQTGTRFVSTNEDITMRVYDATGTTLLYSQDDATDLDLTIPTVDEGATYMIQFGTRAGDDLLATIEWFDATPELYGTSAGAVEIDGTYGGTEVTLKNTGEAWLSWIAQETTDVTFSATAFPSSAVLTARVYEGNTSTQIDTSSGTGGTTVSFPVTLGVRYWLKYSAPTDIVDVYTNWNVAPVIVDEEDEWKTFIVEAYGPDGVTKITEIPRRFGLQFQEPLNEVGAGQLAVKLDDEILDAYPELFEWRNIIKVWLGNRCVHAFRIHRRRTTYVSTEEWAGMVREVSGPSVMYLLEDFIVRHDGLMHDRSLDVRNFGWMAVRGEWFDSTKWDLGVYNTNSQDDPPGKVGEAAEDRAKFGNPPNWPDETSKWMWVSNNPAKNETGFDPPAMKGKRYFRKEFTITEGHTIARLYATADEVYRIYLDGEEVLSGDGRETGYTELQKKKLILRKGVHTLAIFTRSRGQAIGDGSDAVMLALMALNKKGKPTDVIVHSGTGWKTTYERPVPAWNRASVLRAVVREARDRGHSSANMLTFGFTTTEDNVGRPWTDRFNDEIAVGTSALGVQAVLSEGNGFDVWVDPETFELKAWRRRGTDKSASITLEAGRNLVNWEVEETDEVKNDFLIRYDGGWTRYVSKGSRDHFGDREAMITMGYAKDEDNAVEVIRKASEGVSWAEQRAGTSEIVKRKQTDPSGGVIARQGARPLLDIIVGDTIKAPNQRGILKPHRVLMITANEDSNMQVSYDMDVEEIR